MERGGLRNVENWGKHLLEQFQFLKDRELLGEGSGEEMKRK